MRRGKGSVTLVDASGAEARLDDVEFSIGRAPAEPLRMSIEDLLGLVEPWLGWGYGPIDTDERRVDCSSLTASAVLRILGLQRGEALDLWLDLVVGDSRRPWSPIERLVADGGVEELQAGCLHVCQGWRGLDRDGRFVAGVSRGHAWLWLATADDARRGWVVESTPPVGVRITAGPRRAYSYASRPTADELAPAPFRDRATGWDSVRVARLSEPVFDEVA